MSELRSLLGATGQTGLDDAGVAGARAKVGWNELTRAAAVPTWKRLLRQFLEPVVLLLVGAALVSGAVGEWADTAAILAIVLLNGVLGFVQEDRAERALAALETLAAPLAKVVRSGSVCSVPTRELVPGDLLELETGDKIPADARLVETTALRVQESALTGESVPVEKDATRSVDAEASLGDRTNMVFAGTLAVAGHARAIVVATGMHTELGRIAGLVQAHEPEPTPLQKRLAELGRTLLVVVGVLVAVIFALDVLRGEPLVEAFLLSISLAVAAVPEGLPAIVTIALALGLRRMVRRHALVRKLASVETLGAVTVIASDKTGTLTRDEMTVRTVYAGCSWFAVAGEGFVPEGEFSAVGSLEEAARHRDASAEDRVKTDVASDLGRALAIGALCNHAKLEREASGAWRVRGDPTEGALVVAARKAGLALEPPEVLGEVPFSSERRTMTVVVREQGRVRLLSKGAPEAILAKCTGERRAGAVTPLTDTRRGELLGFASGMAARSLRVLALAERDDPRAQEGTFEECELVFAGFVGLLDPPRAEAKAAVARCVEAGIRPLMITGDHRETALAVARDLGIAREGDGVLTGFEIAALSDEALAADVERVSVYARVSAEHKLRVVKAWKRRGHVVAMTGDGVNDAPALRAADIGIAMGRGGTDAAREASAMVLTDDNFASIVNAVEEGRAIYDNIQKALFYLLSCNSGEILFMLFAALRGWPVPLLPIQLLWINLITDGLPALALGLEPPERDIMRRPPRSPGEPVISVRRATSMLFVGTLMAAAGVVAFAVAYRGDPANVTHARAVAFSVTVFSQLFYSFSCRSYGATMPELGVATNPYLLGAIAGSVLLQAGVVSLSFVDRMFGGPVGGVSDWTLVLGASLAPVTILEVGKILWRKARAARG